MLATFDLRAMGHNSARYIHVVTEALKLAFADRERYYGDPSARRAASAELLVAGVRARARRADPHGSRGARGARARRSARRDGDAGATAPPSGPRRRAGGAGARRHHAHRRDRPRRQHDLPHAERRRVQEVGVRPRARLHAQHAQRDVRARGRPPERARAGQAAAHHADQLPRSARTACPRRRSAAPAATTRRRPISRSCSTCWSSGMNPQQAVEAPRFSTQTLVNSFYPRVYRPGQLNVEPGIPETHARRAPRRSATRSPRSARAASARW